MFDTQLEPAVARDMIKGAADPLVSAFQLRYSQLLQLARTEGTTAEMLLQVRAGSGSSKPACWPWLCWMGSGVTGLQNARRLWTGAAALLWRLVGLHKHCRHGLVMVMCVVVGALLCTLGCSQWCLNGCWCVCRRVSGSGRCAMLCRSLSSRWQT